MYESLTIFRTSAAMARHAGERQLLVAQNVANADTPGYVARSLPGFQAIWRDEGLLAPSQTREGHMAGRLTAQSRVQPAVAEPSPNGNSVSLEMEMLASIDAQREHARALAIWRHGLGVIRTALGR